MANHAASGDGRIAQFTLKQKLIASGAVLATGGALLSGGIYAGWNSVGTTNQDVDAVDLTAGFVEAGGGDSIFDPISDVFPGDFWKRYATLTNSGSLNQTFTIGVDTTTDGLTAAADGLQAGIRSCAVAFASGVCEIGDTMSDGNGGTVANPDDDAVAILAHTYITDAGVMGANVEVAEGTSAHLEVTYTFPANASQSEFEGQSDTAAVTATSLTAGTGGRDRSNG